MRSTLIPLLALPLFACGGDVENPAGGVEEPADEGAGGGAASADALAALHANIAATASRDELDVQRVTVSHILISFAGALRSTQRRSKDEAEALAAQLLARIEAGEDFEQLKTEFSNDPGGGTYTMLASGAVDNRTTFLRSGMAPAFGDVGWRLDVDQVGVAPHDPAKSPFGWHIIKRTE